ncbi:MAG: RluA family pseudouridine synthase [Oscillospiraceae bacterium]|nr:RluA family pseudouridine synthase [Oscillospiraceae bacterium]
MDERIFTVDDLNVGEQVRVDRWISKSESEFTRSMLQKLIKNGMVTVNGKNVSKSCTVKNNDEVKVIVPEPTELDVKPQNLPIEIVYQDSDLLVVNKPKGMVVHPAAGNYDGTLVNALLYHCKGQLSSINGVIRPGIVHRIDKNTSGLLIVAKTDRAHFGLAEQIKAHTFTREYQAVICGKLKEQSGIINAPIGRHPVDRKKMCVTEKNSKPAKTEYAVLEEFNGYSLIKLKLYTGRTHQIRVHMAYIGHPVFGDDVYGRPSKLCEGQCLHAKKIGFVHPIDGKYYEFDSELPDYFRAVLDKLRKL